MHGDVAVGGVQQQIRCVTRGLVNIMHVHHACHGLVGCESGRGFFWRKRKTYRNARTDISLGWICLIVLPFEVCVCMWCSAFVWA